MAKPLQNSSEGSTATGWFSKRNMTNDFILLHVEILSLRGYIVMWRIRPQLNNILGSVSSFTLRYLL